MAPPCAARRRHGLQLHGVPPLWRAVDGPTQTYVRGEHVEFNFCPHCGCVTHWRGLQLTPEGQRRTAVNLRLSEPGPIARIPIDHFDGLDKFEDLPRDGKCVADLWF